MNSSIRAPITFGSSIHAVSEARVTLEAQAGSLNSSTSSTYIREVNGTSCSTFSTSHTITQTNTTSKMDCLRTRLPRLATKSLDSLSSSTVIRATITSSSAPPSTEAKPKAVETSIHGKRRRPLTAEQQRFLDSAVCIDPDSCLLATCLISSSFV